MTLKVLMSLCSGGPVSHVLRQGGADLLGPAVVCVSSGDGGPLCAGVTAGPVIIIQTHLEMSN